MQADYHVHTPLCKHADGEVPEYLAAARAKGVEEVCFTDHGPTPDGYDSRHRMSLDQFPQYRRLVEAGRDHGNIRVLFGIEADYYEGCETFLSAWLPEQNFDLVIGSIHYIREWGFDNPEWRAVWDAVDVADTWREYFGLMSRLADSGLCDVAGHFDLPKKFEYRPDKDELSAMAASALDSIARAGMAIEINTSGLRKPVGEIYPSRMILELARERNVPICFGSDAHTPGDVGHAFPQALALARSAGYTQCVRYEQRVQRFVPLP